MSDLNHIVLHYETNNEQEGQDLHSNKYTQTVTSEEDKITKHYTRHDKKTIFD